MNPQRSLTMPVLSALLVLLSVGTADAQFVKGVGVRVGTALANQAWHYKMSNAILLKDYAHGTFCSLNAEFLKGKNFTLITEVAYAQKGCEEGLPKILLNMPKGFSTYKTYDTRFNYLSSSVLLKVRFENDYWIPYGFVGPRFDYQLSYFSDFDFIIFERYMNETIWGVDYGFGIEYKVLHGGVSAEFRHHYDLENMLDVPMTDSYTGFEIKNNAFILSFGIKYYFRNPKLVTVKPAAQ